MKLGGGWKGREVQSDGEEVARERYCRLGAGTVAAKVPCLHQKLQQLFNALSTMVPCDNERSTRAPLINGHAEAQLSINRPCEEHAHLIRQRVALRGLALLVQVRRRCADGSAGWFGPLVTTDDAPSAALDLPQQWMLHWDPDWTPWTLLGPSHRLPSGACALSQEAATGRGCDKCLRPYQNGGAGLPTASCWAASPLGPTSPASTTSVNHQSWHQTAHVPIRFAAVAS